MVLRPLANLNKNIRRISRLKVSPKRLATIVSVALVIVTLTIAGILIPGGGSKEQPAVTPEPTPTPYIGQNVVPTNRWVNFYSLQSSLDGQALPVGAVITAIDPEGVVCGEFVVTEAGRYGLMPVYGDDSYTLTDEGAVSGDLLEFRINGIKASVAGSDEALWTTMGDLNQVDLTASTSSCFRPQNLYQC